MDLVELILALKPLLDDPEANWPQIAELLEENVELAEYEVARHYVISALNKSHKGGATREMLRDPDPEVRLEGIRRVFTLYPRARAAQALRAIVLDADLKVRRRATSASRMLGLDDVALPDTRRSPGWNAQAPQRRGGWNPSGWLFGSRVYHPTRTGALAQHGLPTLGSRDDLATLVGVDADRLTALMRPGVGSGAPYVEFEIDKRSGGKRRIAAPRAELRAVQRKILDKILSVLPVHDACHGFVRGRSIVTNAEPHQNARVVIKMDLRDFFPTIHYRRVAGMFRSVGYGDEVASLLAGLTTHRQVLPNKTVTWPGVVPQGAPTSPAIANQVAGRLDARLSGLAKRSNARYTRYADDLTFSFESEPEIGIGRFSWWVDQICQQEGFVENVAKRRVLRRGNQQRVTGVVVNSGLFVPRADRRRFRAMLHNCRKNGVAAEARGKSDFPAYLRGFAAYVNMVQPDLGAALALEVEAVLAANP